MTVAESYRGWELRTHQNTNGIDAGYWEWRAYDPEGDGWRAGTSLNAAEALATARVYVDAQMERDAA